MVEHKPIEYESSFTRHLILYSKGHYLRTDDVFKDLRTLMSHYSGVDEKVYSDIAIYTFVSESFVDSCSKNDIKDILKCFYRKPFFIGVGPATLEEMVDHMLGMMGCIQVYEREGDEWVELVKLGEPNPNYLPEPKEGEKALEVGGQG